MSKHKREDEACELNMTPMIDVVFQLIIFFIVTINISDNKDKDVRLEMGPNGQEVETGDDAAQALIIDVSRKGRISIANTPLTTKKLQDVIKGRFYRMGNNFQVWIRGDARASHEQIRKVMDTCTASGLGRVSFVAVKDPRTPEAKQFFAERKRSRR